MLFEAEKNPYSCNHDWLKEWTKPEEQSNSSYQWPSNQWSTNHWSTNHWSSNQCLDNDDYSGRYTVEDTCDDDDRAPQKRRRRC